MPFVVILLFYCWIPVGFCWQARFAGGLGGALKHVSMVVNNLAFLHHQLRQCLLALLQICRSHGKCNDSLNNLSIVSSRLLLMLLFKKLLQKLQKLLKLLKKLLKLLKKLLQKLLQKLQKLQKLLKRLLQQLVSCTNCWPVMSQATQRQAVMSQAQVSQTWRCELCSHA